MAAKMAAETITLPNFDAFQSILTGFFYGDQWTSFQIIEFDAKMYTKYFFSKIQNGGYCGRQNY